MRSSVVNTGQQIGTELHPSPRLVAGLFVLAAVGINFAEAWLGSERPFAIMGFELLLYVTAAAIWVFDSWRTTIGRWIAVIGLALVLHLGLTWLAVPGFLALIVMPVALAAALLGTSAALLTTIAQTAVVLLLAESGLIRLDTSSIITVVAALGMIFGLMAVVYQPVYQIIEWSWEQYQQAQTLLEEARARKVELEQAMDALAHANRDLALLNERVAAMRLVAEEAQKAKTVFVAKVSHEFRTPLNMIIGLTDLLIEKPEVVYGAKLPKPLLEDLKIVHRSCEHLSSMVNDVLDLSQTDIGRLALHREWVNLAAEIDTALTVVKPLLEKKQLSLQVNIPPNLPQVYCDKTRIRQVILNLVSNAARFTETGGITVQVSVDGRYMVVNVTDTGPGISAEDAEHVFDPFFQAGGSMWHNREGSGLGLSISKQFVERHEGQIWLESEVGVGSTFSFKIPLSPLPPAAGGAGRWVNQDWVFLEHPTWPNLPKLPHQRRVVLCDETGDLHTLFNLYADQIEFVDTKNLIETGQELQRCPAHAVILNTNSATELGTIIEQARQEITDTPIIGCSLHLHKEHVFEGDTIDYLIKPVKQANLEKMLQTASKPVQHILIVDDDPDVRQLFSRMVLVYDPTLTISMAANGVEALQQLHAHPPDLMLLDIVMPDMDGWQVLAHKQQDPAIKDIPVIVVSAEDVISQPMVSQVILATMGQGLSIPELLQCSLQFSKLLLEPQREC